MREYRKEKESKGNSNKSSGGKHEGSFNKKKLKATVASVVKKLRKSKEQKDNQLTEMKSIISSLIVNGKEEKKSNANTKTVKFAQSSKELVEIATVKLQKLMAGNKGRKSGRP